VKSIPRFLLGAAAGFVIGAALLLVGLLRAGAARFAGVRVSFDRLVPEAAIFLASFVLGGAITVLLWPPQPVVWRQRLAFVAGTTCVIMGLVSFDHGLPTQWGIREWAVTLVVGAVFGYAGHSGWSA
jgi:hypothetical protein